MIFDCTGRAAAVEAVGVLVVAGLTVRQHTITTYRRAISAYNHVARVAACAERPVSDVVIADRAGRLQASNCTA